MLSSPEFPISASYAHAAGAIEQFVAGVSGIYGLREGFETVRFRVSAPGSLEAAHVSSLRKTYPTMDVIRFLTSEHGVGGDEANVAFCIDLPSTTEGIPYLNMQVGFKGVIVGKVALQELNANDADALRGALTGQLVPDKFWLVSVSQDPKVILEGVFGSSVENPDDMNVRMAAAMIDIAATEMNKFDPNALDRTALANRNVAVTAIPFGVVS